LRGTSEELMANGRFLAAMREIATVRRAWGPLGLFWALLQDRLEMRSTEKLRIAAAPSQAHVVRGSAAKARIQYSFRRRRAMDQERSRRQQ
jgi:hypothetical protein